MVRGDEYGGTDTEIRKRYFLNTFSEIYRVSVSMCRKLERQGAARAVDSFAAENWGFFRGRVAYCVYDADNKWSSRRQTTRRQKLSPTWTGVWQVSGCDTAVLSRICFVFWFSSCWIVFVFSLGKESGGVLSGSMQVGGCKTTLHDLIFHKICFDRYQLT